MGFMVWTPELLAQPSIQLLDSTQSYEWVKTIVFNKNFGSQGGFAFSLARSVNSINGKTFVGYFDRSSIYNKAGQLIQTVTDSNTLRFENSTWKSIGKISFSHSHSAILHSDTINGKEYVTVVKADSVGPLARNIYFLDESLQRFFPVHELLFTGAVKGFTRVTANEAIVFGNFYSGQDISGLRKDYVGASLWNIPAKTMDIIPGGLGEYYAHHTSEIDGTTMILTGSGFNFRIIRKGYKTFKEDLYPSIPVSPPSLGSFRTTCVVDSTHIYPVLRNDSTFLLGLKGVQWEKLLRFSKTGTLNPNIDIVNSVRHYNGWLTIIGAFDSVNGIHTGPIISYDTVTKKVVKLPFPPFSSQSINTSKIEVIGGELYLLADNNLGNGIQTVYKLTRKMTPPTITESSVSGSLVTIKGNSQYPNALAEFVLNDPNIAPYTSVSTNSSGSFEFSEHRVNGNYTTYVRIKTAEGITSSVSSQQMVNVVIATPLITSPQENENFTTSVVWSVNHPQNGVNIKLYKQNGTDSSLIGSCVVVSNMCGGTLSLPPGEHKVFARANDSPIGNLSQKTQLRTFTVIVTGVPTLPTEQFGLYPNPVTDKRFTIKDVLRDKKPIVRDVLGRIVNTECKMISVNSGTSAEISLKGAISSGTYFVTCTALNKQLVTIKIIVK